MRALAFAIVLTACAAAPGPKRPDESRRMPVNQSVPAEVAGDVRSDQADSTASKRSVRDGEVEWQ